MNLEPSHTYGFEVEKRSLAEFINLAGRGDDMGGNEIIYVRDRDDFITIVILKREHYYPYIINRLVAIPGVRAPGYHP